MLELSKRLIEQLNDNDVRWIIWKGCYHYEDGFNGNGDIDLFVDPQQMLVAKNVFAQLGFVLFKTQSYIERINVEDWIGIDKITGSLVHIHFHLAMIYGKPFTEEYSFIPSDACLKHSVILPDGVHVQDPSIEFLLFICRLYFEQISDKKIRLNVDYFTNHISREKLISTCRELGINNITSEAIFQALMTGKICEPCNLLKDVACKFSSKDITYAGVRNFQRESIYNICRAINRIHH